MARWRQAIELAMTEEEIGSLTALSRSRTEPARRVERARILIAYGETPSFYAVGQTNRRSSRTRCATTWSVATPTSSRRWQRSCVSIAQAEDIRQAGRDRVL
jgi:hypothetical protein